MSVEFIEKVNQTRFIELTKPIIKMPISQIWRGNGSAIFFEFGKLKEVREYNEIYYDGEFTLMLEWSWRIENVRSIYFGSFSSDIKIDNKLKTLFGKTVKEIKLEGRLPEIIVQLNENFWIHSFSTVEGQPQWTLFLPDRSWLHVERGKIIRERSK